MIMITCLTSNKLLLSILKLQPGTQDLKTIAGKKHVITSCIIVLNYCFLIIFYQYHYIQIKTTKIYKCSALNQQGSFF